LLKAKFAEIKEAYDVLKDPVKRKNYDLTFDNFSYKKEVHLTPHQLLQKIKELRVKTGKLDPHRMDLDRLEFEITEILSERNTNTLTNTEDKDIVQQLIEELLEAARPLSSKQFNPIASQVTPFASPATKEKINRFRQEHAWENRWKNYKIFFAIAAGVLLCLLIYLLGR
jgi:molecular chaperone DnaJ